MGMATDKATIDMPEELRHALPDIEEVAVGSSGKKQKQA